MTSLSVELLDLRRALAAVTPHVPAPKDHLQLARVRLTPFAHTLEVTATDRYTIALALVSVYGYDDDAADIIDLSLADVKKVLAVFKAPEKGEEVEIRISTTREEVTFADVSGLVTGETLILQRVTGGDDLFPDLRAMFAGHLQAGATHTGDFWLNGPLLHRFEAAQRAYGYPLIFEPRRGGRAQTIRCGSSFLGIITQAAPDTEARDEAAGWVKDWNERLPAPKRDALDTLVQVTYTSGAVVDVVDGGDLPEPVEHADILAEAAELVLRTQFASASMLQRKFRIRRAIAVATLDLLAGHGIVGPAEGSKAREVLLSVDDLPDVLAHIKAGRE